MQPFGCTYTVVMMNDDQVAATISVDIEADIEHVWRALTTDSGLEAWMGQGSFIGADAGDEIYVNDPTSGDPKRGVLEQVLPEERLVYSWWSEGSPDQVSEVEISVETVETGTRVTVVERGPAENSGRTVASAAASVGRGASWAWRTALLTLAAQTMFVAATSRA